MRDPSNVDMSFDRARLRSQIADADWLNTEGIVRSARHLAEAEEEIARLCSMERRRAVHSSKERTIYTPQASTFIQKRVVQMIFAERHKEVSLSQVAELVAKLQRSENANLAGVLVSPKNGSWTFEAEPPRQAG